MRSPYAPIAGVVDIFDFDGAELSEVVLTLTNPVDADSLGSQERLIEISPVDLGKFFAVVDASGHGLTRCGASRRGLT